MSLSSPGMVFGSQCYIERFESVLVQVDDQSHLQPIQSQTCTETILISTKERRIKPCLSRYATYKGSCQIKSTNYCCIVFSSIYIYIWMNLLLLTPSNPSIASPPISSTIHQMTPLWSILHDISMRTPYHPEHTTPTDPNFSHLISEAPVPYIQRRAVGLYYLSPTIYFLDLEGGRIGAKVILITLLSIIYCS